MQIQNALITGSFSYNGADLSNITSSNAYSASLSIRTTDLESTSSVLVGASSSFSSILSSVSSSQQQLSSSFLILTASFNAVSASQQQISSSQQQISASLLNVIANYATTGSNSFRADQSITGSLVVSSTITAQTLVVQTVTSSIVYSSGSNLFGNSLSNTQTFTGSVNITGSLALAGNISGNAITLTSALDGTSATFSGNNHSLASNNTLRFTDTDTATEANQQIGKIEFYSSDSSTPGAGVKAYIGAFAQDTTPDAYLSFATQDGSATPNPVERLRISSEGLATFSSSVTATDQIKVSGGGAYLSIYDTQASSKNWAIRAGHDAVGDLAIRQSNSTGGDPVSAGTNRLYFSPTGAATFSNSITATGVSLSPSLRLTNTTATTGVDWHLYSLNNGNFGLFNNTASAYALQIASTGAATFETTSSANAIFNSTNASGGFIAFRRSGTNIGYLGNSAQLGIGTLNALELRADNNLFLTTTSGTLSILSTGNVGIGTSSPQAKFVISNSGAEGFEFIPADSSNYNRLQSYSRSGGVYNTLETRASTHIWAIDATERMRITSTGNVCIGGATIGGEILRVNGCSCSDNYISVYSGTIQMFLDADKTNNAGIVGTQSSHPLILRTNGTNKLSISTAGVLDFPGSNSTATSASDSMSFGVSGASYAWMQTWGGRPLRINELGNNVNAFGTNGYGLVNTTASDVRIKKNIVSIENALDKVNCLRGVYYEFDENNSMCMKVPSGKRRVGLIAQEVGCVLPEALLDSQDDSTPISLDYSGMIGLLTKAIQEQQCTINTLKICLGIS